MPEGANRKRFGEIKQRLTRGARMSGLKVRRRPKTAMDAGVEPRRVRRNGGYQELQRLLPRRWVLELKLGASIYRQIDGVAMNGESPVGDYGGAVDWQEV